MSKEKKIKRMQQQQAMQGAATPNSVLDAVKSNHQNQAQDDELVNNATDFLTMLRTKYLEARLQAGKQA